jgi:uncharacterized protein with GYD domain
MPKYLFKASYSPTGIAGVLREGGSSRAKAIHELAASVNGTVESMYWAFGSDDFILIADVPDAIAAGALSATVSATGVAAVTTTPLLTIEDVDAMSTRTVHYIPPGG